MPLQQRRNDPFFNPGHWMESLEDRRLFATGPAIPPPMMPRVELSANQVAMFQGRAELSRASFGSTDARPVFFRFAGARPMPDGVDPAPDGFAISPSIIGRSFSAPAPAQVPPLAVRDVQQLEMPDRAAGDPQVAAVVPGVRVVVTADETSSALESMSVEPLRMPAGETAILPDADARTSPSLDSETPIVPVDLATSVKGIAIDVSKADFVTQASNWIPIAATTPLVGAAERFISEIRSWDLLPKLNLTLPFADSLIGGSLSSANIARQAVEVVQDSVVVLAAVVTAVGTGSAAVKLHREQRAREQAIHASRGIYAGWQQLDRA